MSDTDESEASMHDSDSGSVDSASRLEHTERHRLEDEAYKALEEQLTRYRERVHLAKEAAERTDEMRKTVQMETAVLVECVLDLKVQVEEKERVCFELSNRERLMDLASRPWDFPLRNDSWNWKEGLVVDLAKFTRDLEKTRKAADTGAFMDPTNVGAGPLQVEVVRMDPTGKRELGTTNIPLGMGPMLRASEDGDTESQVSSSEQQPKIENLLNASCTFWGLDPANYEIENQVGKKFIRSDPVPPGTKNVILREIHGGDDVVDEIEESEKTNDILLNDFSTSTSRKSENDSDTAGRVLGRGERDNDEALSLAVAKLSNAKVSKAEMNDAALETTGAQAGHDTITRRDSRSCRQMEMLLAFFLAATFVVFNVDYSRVFSSYLARLSIERRFSDPLLGGSSLTSGGNGGGDFTFYEVDSEEKMWMWLQMQFTREFKASVLLNQCLAAPNTILGATFVSNPYLSQLRVAANSTCSPVYALQTSNPCYGPFVSPQNAVPFATLPAASSPAYPAFIFESPFGRTKIAGSMIGSTCMNWPTVTSDSLPGLYDYYPIRQADKYGVYLTQSEISSQLDEMKTNDWADESTRLVALDFTTTDLATGSMVNVIATFEFLPSGGVFPRWHAYTVWAMSISMTFAAVFLALTCLLVVFSFMYDRTMYPTLTRGFSVRGLTDVLTLLFAALWYVSVTEVQQWFNNANKNGACGTGASFHADFRGVAFQVQLLNNFSGIVIVLYAVRVVKFLDDSPSMTVLTRTLSNAGNHYLSLAVIVAALASGFALLAHFIFGRTMWDFFVADLAFASLWISFSIDNSGAYAGVSSWGAIVLSLIVYFVMFFVVFFLCFAVTAGSYVNVMDSVRRRGYFWLSSRSPQEFGAEQRYVEAIVVPSGMVSGLDALKRAKTVQNAKRTYGNDD